VPRVAMDAGGPLTAGGHPPCLTARVGMITGLLPGLRELRAPLAAGYLWLVVAWLWFRRGSLAQFVPVDLLRVGRPGAGPPVRRVLGQDALVVSREEPGVGHGGDGVEARAPRVGRCRSAGQRWHGAGRKAGGADGCHADPALGQPWRCPVGVGRQSPDYLSPTDGWLLEPIKEWDRSAETSCVFAVHRRQAVR
jgi:hypothetical protein